MRSITKIGSGGRNLDNAHRSPPPTSGEATSRWSSFGHKADLVERLLFEQYGLCAYSEIRPDLSNLGTHIEHIEPKSANPLRTFDYSNLVLSALSSDDLKTTAVVEVFGGHAKRDKYNPALFVSCLQADCARYFVYLSDGRVEPSKNLNKADSIKTQYTIDLLNLNSAYLVNQRKKWLDELDDLINEHLTDDMSLTCLATVDLIPYNRKLSPFFTATRQRFNHIAEQLLAAEAPELV